MPTACRDHLLSYSACTCWFFVATSLIGINFSACYKYLVKEGKKNLKFLLVTSNVEFSFSIAGFKPRGPSGCLVSSQKSDLSMCVSSGKHTESLQMVPVLSYLISKMFVLYSPPPRGRKNQKW